ncbi:hypothetical protein QR680_017244 [Steinernema hermaphroditum]|uniref:BZIP domain-containing protein n=1 Tax=Steinernema hermaphroditum TaxID=289476 RepID=A0AA39HDV1_9BILA|nr:hypothetical protein QR680_017244 [Steinernema hermaphroditum]
MSDRIEQELFEQVQNNQLSFYEFVDACHSNTRSEKEQSVRHRPSTSATSFLEDEPSLDTRRTRSVSALDLRPSRAYHRTPTEVQETVGYKDWRARNNLAVKRSREKHKKEVVELRTARDDLQQQVSRLEGIVGHLRKEMCDLRLANDALRIQLQQAHEHLRGYGHYVH